MTADCLAIDNLVTMYAMPRFHVQKEQLAEMAGFAGSIQRYRIHVDAPANLVVGAFVGLVRHQLKDPL